MRRTALTAAALLAALLIPTLVHVPLAKAADTGFLSDVNNTVIVSALTTTGTILVGKHLNGTIGYVYVQNLPLDGEYTLVASDGTTLGPEPSFGREVLFFEVPLYKTGSWTVVDAAQTLVTAFTSTRTEELLGDRVVIDVPLGKDPDLRYDSGDLRAYEYDGPSAQCLGKKHPSGYALVSTPVNVTADYKGNFALGSDTIGVFHLSAQSDELSVATTKVVRGTDSGEIYVHAEWHAGGTYIVTLQADTYRLKPSALKPNDPQHVHDRRARDECIVQPTL